MTNVPTAMHELALADPARDARLEPAAAERILQQLRQAPQSPPARHGRRWRGRGLLMAATIVLLLVAATVALAAAGVFRTGSPVQPSTRPQAGVGEGVPVRGRSELLALRVPDPEGGLPWGLRIVHTTRGLVCLQVGRVSGDQLGELGIDGAFHDDGLFHPLPADVLPREAVSGHSETATCALAGSQFADEQDGVDRNAFPHESGVHGAIGHLRDLSYGLLGEHALSVSYGKGPGRTTEAVSSPAGAYLVVTMAGGRQIGVGGGVTAPGEVPGSTVQPQGVVDLATYRFAGKLCVRSTVAHKIKACPPPSDAPFRMPGPPRQLHRPIGVALDVVHGAVVDARLTFRAPYSVTDARNEYAVRIPLGCRDGTDGIPIDRDVRRGAIVHVVVPRPFVNACGRSVTIEVYFGPSNRAALPARGTIVGSVVLAKPGRG